MLKGYTKAEKSWMLYDWANSAFATIIAAIILPIFFKEIAHQNGVSDVDATAFWGYATSCGTLICAVLAPFMGTLGDFKGMKKRLFTFFMLLGVISSALLAFTEIGRRFWRCMSSARSALTAPACITTAFCWM